jgi:hypothetical protein
MPSDVLPMGAWAVCFSGMADHERRVDLCGHYAHHYGDDWRYLTVMAGR